MLTLQYNEFLTICCQFSLWGFRVVSKSNLVLLGVPEKPWLNIPYLRGGPTTNPFYKVLDYTSLSPPCARKAMTKHTVSERRTHHQPMPQGAGLHQLVTTSVLLASMSTSQVPAARLSREDAMGLHLPTSCGDSTTSTAAPSQQRELCKQSKHCASPYPCSTPTNKSPFCLWSPW